MPLILRAPLPRRVTCVIPTGDRPQFLQQALQCFREQTYADRELIVVDDGAEPVERMVVGQPHTRYIRLRNRSPIGTKLNIGIEYARGSIIQKLDDDDYYGPDFLAAATQALPSVRRDKAVVAWCCYLALTLPDLTLRVSGHGWARAGTFCFYRKLWERYRFDATNDDHAFLRKSEARVIRVCRPDLYIYVRHGRNTCARFGRSSPEHYLEQLPVYQAGLEHHVGKRHFEHYRALGRSMAEQGAPKP